MENQKKIRKNTKKKEAHFLKVCSRKIIGTYKETPGNYEKIRSSVS